MPIKCGAHCFHNKLIFQDNKGPQLVFQHILQKKTAFVAQEKMANGKTNMCK